ncbi:cysteine hydrolase [Humibacter sp. BT305]|nr:cysteine hydrolase [Humibacter sp. BT305]
MNALAESRRSALVDAGRPALLVVDVQRDFADPDTLAGWGVSAEGLAAVDAAVTTTAALVEDARRSDVAVVWIELAYDPAHPWRSSAWLQTGSPDAPTDGFPCVVGSPGAEWWRLSPAPGEARIRKRFYSGFAGTELAATLDALGAGWVAIAGLTTECCILATAFDAAQHDLPSVVVGDATAAYTAELHRSALETLALNAAEVMPASALAELWERSEVAR